jgi:hypothetical protein
MERIDHTIRWRDVEAVLFEHYETGKSKEGADAYPAIPINL